MGVALFSIRPMTTGDLPAVLRIEEATYPQPWPEKVFRDELGAPDRTYIVAEDLGEVVGYGGLLQVGTEAHVTTVAVAPDARQQGLGTRLMLRLIEEGLKAGAKHLTLEVRFSNRRAQELYRRFGLMPVGVRKNYYGSEDALIMWANDIDGDEFRARLERISEALQ